MPSRLDDTHTDYLNAKITWLATALAWGSIRIVMDRNVNFDLQYFDPGPISNNAKNSNYSLTQDVTCAVLEDDVWGYGQVVTVALLLAPLIAFFESIYGKCELFPNATHFWIIRKHTERLLAPTLPPTKSVIVDRENPGRLPTSASTLPPIESVKMEGGIQINRRLPHQRIAHRGIPNYGSSDGEPYTGLYDYAWFRSLLWLIYLQSLATAANFLLLFPWGDGSVDLEGNIRLFVAFYSTWFGLG